MFPSNKKPNSASQGGSGATNERPNSMSCVQADSGLVLTTDPKPRLRWTVELHDRFVDAVTQLGGPDSMSSLSLFSSYTLLARPSTFYQFSRLIALFGIYSCFIYFFTDFFLFFSFSLIYWSFFLPTYYCLCYICNIKLLVLVFSFLVC